jgi:uncharacterized tellurite resistance protein B-like protein
LCKGNQFGIGNDRCSAFANKGQRVQHNPMSNAEITRVVLDLPAEERLELARKLVESVVTPSSLEGKVEEGIRRIEDVLSGKTVGLTEAQYRRAIG